MEESTVTTAAEFQIEYLQYLQADGKAKSDLPSFASDETLMVNLYKTMVQVRAYDTKAIALQRTGKMGTYASTLGQEALSAATGAAMQKDDVFAPYYRDYAAQIQRSVSMLEIYQYWGGDERGNCYQNNPHDFPMSVPIGSQCLHAAGAAFAFKYRKQNRVAVTTIGEGGTSEGDFYEALNVAGAWKLPVVFVVNNNQWAISVPRGSQTACETIAQKAIAAGFEGIQIDGNDIIACRKIIGDAIDKARRGDGPTLVEAITYRLCDHTTADDASRYREDNEVTNAQELEPIKRTRAYLTDVGFWNDEKEAALQVECKKNVDAVVEQYLNIEQQPLENLFDYHYAELPANLVEQRQEVIEGSL